MANNFDDDLYDIENLTDDELRSLVLDHFRESSELDIEDIDVQVSEGAITLSGRVGTDAEVQTASNILDDLLDVPNYRNEILVDPLRRAHLPEAADDAAAVEARDQEEEIVLQQSDTAEHLVEDLESETFGTEDMGKAIRDAAAYSPPDGPRPDGYDSLEEH